MWTEIWLCLHLRKIDFSPLMPHFFVSQVYPELCCSCYLFRLDLCFCWWQNNFIKRCELSSKIIIMERTIVCPLCCHNVRQRSFYPSCQVQVATLHMRIPVTQWGHCLFSLLVYKGVHITQSLVHVPRWWGAQPTNKQWIWVGKQWGCTGESQTNNKTNMKK